MKVSIPLFDRLSDRVTVCPIRDGLEFHWTRKGVGFGILTLAFRRGRFSVDSECMGPELCAGVVKQAIEETPRL